jgi:hypothetical protein
VVTDILISIMASLLAGLLLGVLLMRRALASRTPGQQELRQPPPHPAGPSDPARSGQPFQPVRPAWLADRPAEAATPRLVESRNRPTKSAVMAPWSTNGRVSGAAADDSDVGFPLAVGAANGADGAQTAAHDRSPAPAAERSPQDLDPFSTRVITARPREFPPALGPDALPALPSKRRQDQPAAIGAGTPQDRQRYGQQDEAAAILVVHPGNGQPTKQVLAGGRSNWRIGAAADAADIVIPEVGTDILIGRNGDVWTAASTGPIQNSVTLDAVTLPTVPMPWPPERKLRVGAITMTLERIPEPAATLADPTNQTHASLDGLFAAHASRYALALARSGSERAESVAAAALACFDSRLLDPARGAALATLNMTLALRSQLTEDQEFDTERTPLAVGIVGFDHYGRFRAAANFPMAVWAVTSNGPVQLGETRAGLDSVEVEPVRVREDLLQDMDRPLLLIAAGPDLSVVGKRLRGLTTLNATSAQLAAAVIGPLGTDSPLAVAVAARTSVRTSTDLVRRSIDSDTP